MIGDPAIQFLNLGADRGLSFSRNSREFAQPFGEGFGGRFDDRSCFLRQLSR